MIEPNDRDRWSSKQHEFLAAMQYYELNPIYQRITRMTSYGNIGLQLVLLLLAFKTTLAWSLYFVAFLMAYLLADFINGLVHLYMDTNDHYMSVVGPFIAAFHLHHHNPRYKDKALWRVYVDESGFKTWLLFFQIGLLLLWFLWGISSFLFVLGVCFSILSSCAEVSHYLCHNSQAPMVKKLQQWHVLLPKQHHLQHHQKDNINYAFLNGLTDPLINAFASRFATGYKLTTDSHIALYQHVKCHKPQ